jgi:hypothetical protein
LDLLMVARRSLGRQFGWLWAAYAVSVSGTCLAFGAFPLIAILVLHAGPTEVDFVAELKRQPGGTILRYGNGPLDRVLMANNLIDEFHLLLTPVAAGSGQHLFEEIRDAPQLSLADVRRFASGVLVLIYTPKTQAS